MTENEILDIFRAHSALLEGHFILSSGLDSDRYAQCAQVREHLVGGRAVVLAAGGQAALPGNLRGGGAGAGGVWRPTKWPGARRTPLFTERQEGAMTRAAGSASIPASPRRRRKTSSPPAFPPARPLTASNRRAASGGGERVIDRSAARRTWACPKPPSSPSKFKNTITAGAACAAGFRPQTREPDQEMSGRVGERRSGDRAIRWTSSAVMGSTVRGLSVWRPSASPHRTSSVPLECPRFSARAARLGLRGDKTRGHCETCRRRKRAFHVGGNGNERPRTLRCITA